MRKMSTEEVRAAWRSEYLVPLWESPTAHKAPPKPPSTHLWKWEKVRPLVELSFLETSPAAIERRVLQFTSPHADYPREEYTVGNIAACIQSILPGETARPHRHTMNAIRFILEGNGAITTVDGKDCPMNDGDLLLTPGWAWHEHRHEGDKPAMWLDALDVPLHNKLGTVKFQPPPLVDVPHTMEDASFSVPNILPVEIVRERSYTPIFHYPYVDAVKALDAAPASPDGARRIRYVNPLDGGPAMPLLDCQMMGLDKGVPTRRRRTNANIFCLVIDGEGESTIGDDTISWGPRDAFTIPQGNWASHTAKTDDVRIFTISDSDTIQRLGLLEEETEGINEKN